MTEKEKREIRQIKESEHKKHPSYSKKRLAKIANAVVYHRKALKEAAKL